MQGGAPALSPEGVLPRHMIQLTLSTRAPNTNTIHQTMENEFAKDKWQKVERDVHKLENTQLYRHESVGELAVGVKLSGTGRFGLILIHNPRCENWHTSDNSGTQNSFITKIGLYRQRLDTMHSINISYNSKCGAYMYPYMPCIL